MRRVSKWLSAVALLVAIGYLAWPEDRARAVQRHISVMEDALQASEAEPDSDDHMAAYERHRDELLSLGHLTQAVFDVPVRLGTNDGGAFVRALIEHAESRPDCTWRPSVNGVVVSVFADAEQMPGWERLMAKWNAVRTAPEQQNSG